MKIDKFVVAIIVVILVAYLFAEWGIADTNLPLDKIASIGIAFIFFFYGLKLKIQQIKAGLKNWRLHLLVQTATFVIFPLLVLMTYPIMQALGEMDVWLAFLFMAAVPSTVSSSVVMVSVAHGNIPAAIFNASLSGIIGIAITPLWMGEFIDTVHTEFDYSVVYIQLLVEIVLPLVLGLCLQKWLHQWALRHASKLTLFDKSIILLIIYKSFAYSFSENLLSGISWQLLLGIFIGVIVIFYVMFYLLQWISKRLGFSKADQITAQFCGTKKSLVHGTVFSKVLFSGTPIFGLIILPLMVFHAIQIFIISIIAVRYAHSNTQE